MSLFLQSLAVESTVSNMKERCSAVIADMRFDIQRDKNRYMLRTPMGNMIACNSPKEVASTVLALTI